MEPIICFGQQPCGFFPKRFLVAKINTARSLQKEIGGKIVFFYHDSDADYRETITIMTDRQSGAEVRLNFTQENKIQKKFSPLYLKRIPAGWKEETLKQLPRFIDSSILPSPLLARHSLGEGGAGEGARRADEGGKNLIDIFKSISANTVADFCLEMYKKMGLLDGIEIVRSSDKTFRTQTNLSPSRLNPNASEDEWMDPLSSKILPSSDSSEALGMALNGEYFADLPYQGEIVRAKVEKTRASLHEGGGKFTYFDLPDNIEKVQINPGKDERFAWMNSVIHCTHYIAGNSEYDYIKREQFEEARPVNLSKENIDKLETINNNSGPDDENSSKKIVNGVKFIKREQIENSEMAWID